MKCKILLLALAVGAVSCGGDANTELFNGRDLTGWVCVTAGGPAAAEVFTVQDGCIRVAGQPFGFLRTAEQYGDYRLHAEWRWIGKPSNSGLFQRIQEGDELWPSLIECQLESGNAGDLLGLGGATMAGVESPEGGVPVKKRVGGASEKPAGEWNEAEVICKGDRITVYVNGVLQNECSGVNTRGYIALQSEGGPLEFRNIYLTEVE